MTIRFDFHGDFIAKGAKAAGAWSLRHRAAVPDVRFCDTPKRPRRGMAVTKLLMTAALVACASPALAGGWTSTWSCRFSGHYGYSNCRTTWTRVPDPVRDPEQERLDAIALQQENAKWDAFCKPTFTADEFGVHRASYAKKGCEFGRSE
jgi:hypothetical protein